jgi:sortase A
MAKKKKSNFFNNLLLLVSILMLLVGVGIVGKVVYSEYIRMQDTDVLLEQAQTVTEVKIPRSDFDPQQGDVVGTVSIPSQNMIVPITEGTDDASLVASVGHETVTHWPGDGKQIFLAGHRNTEFGALQYVQPGDEIIMDMPYGTYTYVVTEMKVVPETEVSVIEPYDLYPKDQLVLMTCYPFTFGADTADRYLVYAELKE